MRRLTIQIQPARSPGARFDGGNRLLGPVATKARVSRGDDGGKYVNINYETGDLAGLWGLVREELCAVPGLDKSCYRRL